MPASSGACNSARRTGPAGRWRSSPAPRINAMCGIAGIVRWGGHPALADDVRAMCDAMIHRGPDDVGVYADDRAAIGMRRLSIIDLSTGHQPVRNEDGTIWVVFNGEIYNYKELRASLIRRGHHFYTKGDAETLVHLYEDEGPAMVDHLRGMFAFAVWDVGKRRLFLARDRLGIKPLYYVRLRDGLAFASELKAILQLSEVDRQLSWPSVGHLFAFLSSSATHSIVEGVQKLEPAHRALLSRSGELRVERYWDLTFQPDRCALEDELLERLQALMAESMALHVRSDVPLGVLLSGGIDSSAVLALMRQVVSGPIKTFSIGFSEPGFDEVSHARSVASRFETEHHELLLEPGRLETLDDLTWHLDEPFGDSSSIATYMVSQLAGRYVKVVLSGDGGDEIFGGYDKYVVERRERVYDHAPRVVRRTLAHLGEALPEGTRGRNFLRHLGLDGTRRYLDASMLFSQRDQAQLFQPEVAALVARSDPSVPAARHLQSADAGWLSALQYCDLQTYLPLDILTKLDRMSIAHSVEARPVLLDHRLVEFAATIPPELR